MQVRLPGTSRDCPRGGRGAICLDGRSLGLRCGTGVSHYAATLANGLAGTGRPLGVLLDGEQRLGRLRRWTTAAVSRSREASAADPPDGFVQAWTAGDVFRIAQVHVDIRRRLLAVESRHPPALMHWTYPLPLWFRGVPNVYTIHDLIPLRAPELTDIAQRRFLRIVKAVTERAAHIVTVSETSRRDIIRLLHVAPEKVTNTYQAAPVPPLPRDAPPPGHSGHFLFCGTIEPRKNVGRLVAAYQASGAERPLILVGPDGWQAAQELGPAAAAIRRLDMQAGAALPAGHGIWRAHWLPRTMLLDLLRGARALLFPSLAEGFGLPIVEAMTLGVPVLTSSGSATEEVAGDAALLAAPRDTQALAEAIAALDREDGLCDRLRTAGLRRSALFTQAACLGRLNAVYEKLENAHA